MPRNPLQAARSDHGKPPKPSPERRDAPGAGDWLAILYLIAAVLLPGLLAAQQMSFIRAIGPDLHMPGAILCAVGALIGSVAFVRLVRSRTKGRNRRAAAAALLAGAIIFTVAAIVTAATPDPESVPRAGGTQGEALQ